LNLLWSIFGPMIQYSLNEFKETWNGHTVSGFGVPGFNLIYNINFIDIKYRQKCLDVEVENEPLSVEE